MPFANSVVAAVLRSPLRRLLAGTTIVIRYDAPSSGRRVTTPVQYAQDDADLLVLVGRSASKTWWRAFRTPHDLEVLLQGRWTPMTGFAIRASEDRDLAAELRSTYLRRFPRAAAHDDGRAGELVIVRLTPRHRGSEGV